MIEVINMKICIDIGHGKDTYPPSKGIGDFAEFTFNNAVGKYAKKMLEEQGFEVFLSQPFDGNDVSLRNRTNAINKAKCDFGFSIHANAHANTRIKGHWVFYWHESDKSLKLANIWDKYANELPNKRMGVTPSKTGTWTNFHICRETNMPFILVEHAFFTNPEELKLLKTDGFRKQCAEIITKAACEYAGKKYKKEVKEKKKEVSKWAKDAQKWVKDKGISDGKNPKETATREEIWTMIYRANGGK
jgi:N-acetylmuramoyl-L-alanine amidase